MSHDYTPRRCSKRWLDGDCPREILAIMDHPRETDRYTVFYVDVYGLRNGWMTYLSLDADARTYHGEMETHKVAQYRYAQKHRYARWSDLPVNVQAAVRADIASATSEADA